MYHVHRACAVCSSGDAPHNPQRSASPVCRLPRSRAAATARRRRAILSRATVAAHAAHARWAAASQPDAAVHAATRASGIAAQQAIAIAAPEPWVATRIHARGWRAISQLSSDGGACPREASSCAIASSRCCRLSYCSEPPNHGKPPRPASCSASAHCCRTLSRRSSRARRSSRRTHWP